MSDPVFLDYLHFLQAYSWVYDFKLTRFLADEVWNQAPEEWMSALSLLSNDELNQVPFGFIKNEWPESLQQFVKKALSLSSLSHIHSSAAHHGLISVPPASLSAELQRGMNPKKQHEVSVMGAVVAQLCQQQNVANVVDVGSGLGYLGQVLCSNHALHVLGMESVDGRTHGATNMAASKKTVAAHERLQSCTFQLEDTEQSFSGFHRLVQKHFKETSGSAYDQTVKNHDSEMCENNMAVNDSQFENHNSIAKCDQTQNCDINSVTQGTSDSDNITAPIDSNSYTGINDTAAKTSGDIMPSSSQVTMSSDEATLCPKVCMVGLHCCADLTPTMLKLFCQSSSIDCMLCLGCCYHNMKSEGAGFNNFPLSRSLSKAYKEVQETRIDWIISQYALRLAAQETRSRWRHQSTKDHSNHVNNVAYRAIVEMYCQKVGSNLQKTKRKVVNKSACSSFSSYVTALLDRIELTSEPTEHTEAQEELQRLHDSHQQYFSFIEPITCLQVVLQPVLETLILLDRRMYLQENGYTASLLPLFDDAISPRNVAIIATKT